MKDCVDAQLRDQQAGFRKDRSCTDQIAALRIIVEQSIEWNSSLYINFIDYEKAFDSVDRTILWKLLRHYGVPQKNRTWMTAAVGLNIHKGRSKIVQYNTACTNPITIDGEDLEDVKTFTYLGSIIDEHGGSDADVKTRLGKVRAAYLHLRNSKQPSTNIKVRIFLYKCQDSSTVWGRNLENYESHHPENTGVY
ncbi:unnamed protein product [Schistosoma margrebowiei]|uniref:Uncharacterized protein n=1 Tax=Schistosoma margrebowiei TaxID=48269 RepID=A0A183MQL6_9TREM|nr:unnamed protein product [Schistosoma margrebowiei]